MANNEREEAAIVAKERKERYIDGLEAELAGYERAGNTERATQVRAEITRAKREGVEPPAGRTAPQKQTVAPPPAR